MLLAAALAGCVAPAPGGPAGAGGAAGNASRPDASVTVQQGTFVHEHAAFTMVIGGANVSFRGPAYDYATVRGRAHMHALAPDHGDSIIHVEAYFRGGVPDVTLAEFFGMYNITLRQGFVQLDTHDHHNGTAWSDNGTQAWHVLASRIRSPGRTAFAPVPADPGAFVPRQGDEVLLAYGAYTDAQLAELEGRVPDPAT